jgi:signal transduction histidine kinase
MQTDLLSEARLNRLLANARLTLAVFFLIAVVVDPDPHQPRALYLLLAYLLIAASALIYVVADVDQMRSRYFLVMFCVDSVASVLIIYATAGSSSPFASMFVLLMFSASGRWGSRGAAITTACVLLVIVTTGLKEFAPIGANVDYQRLIGRLGVLLTVGGLIAAFGRHEEHVRSQIQRLSSIGLVPAHASDQPPVVPCIEHALTVLGVDRAMLIWGDPEEPRLTVTRWRDGRIEEEPWLGAPDQPHPVLQDLHQPFLADLANDFSRMVTEDGRTARAPPELLASPLLNATDMDRVLVAPIQATGFMGWLIVEGRDMRGELLLIGATLSAQLSVMVEGWRSLQVWRDAAAAETRVRIARDLHDGTLQFLAGAALQLEALDRSVELDSSARDRVRQIRQNIAHEQGELRGLIVSLEAPSAPLTVDATDFAEETHRLVARLRRQWGVHFEVDLDTAFYSLPTPLAGELLQLVREASSNAVRHGAARKVEISGAEHAGGLTLRIRDNGRGMHEHGVFNLKDLAERDLGPRSVRARVTGLSGHLRLVSDDSGTELEIRVPFVRQVPA